MKTVEKNLGKIRKIFSSSGVSAAYVFGSQVDGTATKTSDIDIAVLLSKKLTNRERFETRLSLIKNLNLNLNQDIDVIVLNDLGSLLFKYLIVTEGKIIYCRHETELLDFEIKTMGFYFDFKPFLDSYNKNYVKRGV